MQWPEVRAPAPQASGRGPERRSATSLWLEPARPRPLRGSVERRCLAHRGRGRAGLDPRCTPGRPERSPARAVRCAQAERGFPSHRNVELAVLHQGDQRSLCLGAPSGTQCVEQGASSRGSSPELCHDPCDVPRVLPEESRHGAERPPLILEHCSARSHDLRIDARPSHGLVELVRFRIPSLRFELSERGVERILADARRIEAIGDTVP